MTAISNIAIQACRGFLEPREIPMSAGMRPTSVCILGDNGTGKSSIGDALEFFFSPEGIVLRLGKKQTENNAGASALVHAKAAERKLRPQIALELGDGRVLPRMANYSGGTAAMSADVQAIIDAAPVPRLMRSHEMKTFVADEKGAKRYEILARWIGLGRLTALQDALQRIEGKVGKAKWSQPSAAKEAQHQQVSHLTTKAVPSWDVPALIQWTNAELAAKTSGRVTPIAKLAELERAAAEVLALQSSDEATALIKSYETAIDGFSRAIAPLALVSKQAEERAAAHLDVLKLRNENSAAELRELWSAARAYLVQNDDADCPVCTRPFDEKVSREGVVSRLDESLLALQVVADAEARLTTSSAALMRAVAAADAVLGRVAESLDTLPDVELEPLRVAVKQYRSCGSAVSSDPLSHQADLRKAITALEHSVSAARDVCSKAAERLRGVTANQLGALVADIRQLASIRDQWTRADNEERHLDLVREQFRMTADAIRVAVRAHVKSIIEQLQSDVTAIYAALRGNDDHIPVVNVVVADDKKSMNVEISLFGITNVPPSGYLSDSQLNSLGLAIYLAAVRRFNTSFPFVVLDDIMSSYDASHRLNLVHVIHQYLGEYQVIVTTHDEVFHAEMKAGLASTGDWQFIRLQPWLLETGVRFHGDVSSDEDIERRLRDGELSEVMAQRMMSSVEKWLCKVCDDGGSFVRIRIKKDGSTAPPTMKDLWAAAQPQFNDPHKAHKSFPMLGAHPILNWPRHAGTSDKLKLSLGELATFWKHFKAFRDDFGAPPPPIVT